MPASAKNTVAWSDEAAAYQLHNGVGTVALGVESEWVRWLDDHSSFAFKGREGRLNLLKESRKGGSGYWYAYRRQATGVTKRYAGRSAEITFDHLEEVARSLGVNGEQSVVPQTVGQVVAGDGKSGPNTSPASLSEPLLAPKLQPPRLHSSLVRRERLLAMLNSGREGKLTLVNAPAGFGKTTLVRQWLAEAAQSGTAPATAWLSLDRGDNDPLRFWRYLITASRAFGPEVGAQSLALLETPLSIRSPLDMSLTAFVNELAQVRQDAVLVLEDYHAITTQQIHDILGFLLDHLPPYLHLLIITRTTPPLPLARLRAAGELVEVEAPELRFSAVETETFLKQSSAVTLPPAEVAQVETHVEGWAAGLRLLSLALEGRQGAQDAGDIRLIVDNFIAGRRGIGEYFVDEVLNNQPAPLQLFVLQTSVLESLTASLCDSVTGRSNSAAMLEMLDRANLFLEPLDEVGLWYRYHALFAAAMQTEARRRLGETAVRELLERAVSWYEEHNMPDDAIEAAFAAGNLVRAADLVEVVTRRQLSYEEPNLHATPEFYTLQRWLSQLPEAIMNERPLLTLALAIAKLFIYLMDMRPPASIVGNDIERLLAKAEKGFQATGEAGRLGQVYAFRSLVVRERGEIAAAVEWATAALQLLPPQELSWRNVCEANLGIGESVLGHPASAALHFEKARAMCQLLGNRTFDRANAGMLGWIYIEQNELHRASALFRPMLAEARAVNDVDDIGHSLHALAEIAFCWNDLDAAWAHASEAVEVTQQFVHEPYHIFAVLLLARTEQARGMTGAALARCEALLAGRDRAVVPLDKQLNAHIEFERARIALAGGDLAAAQRWRANCPTGLEMSRTQLDRQQVLLARLLFAEGDAGAAVSLLEPLLSVAGADGRVRDVLEIQVSLVLAYAATGQAPRARQTVTEALSTAHPENAMRSFVDGGEHIAAVLRATLPSLTDRHLVAFARSIVRATGAASGTADSEFDISEPLSQQEQRVLRLIAAGRSNPEIASDLVVSVNTVKAHVKNVYRKLNVGNRLEAASAARQLGLG